MGILKVWGFITENNLSPKSNLKFYFTICWYWLAIADHKNIFRSFLT